MSMYAPMVAGYGIMYDVAYVGVRTNHIRFGTVWYAYVKVMHA
jgi:hypothetical protein